MRALGGDVGFGLPSVKEVLKSIVGSRHRSAHSAGYTPAAGDVVELPHNLRLVGICTDTALTASVKVAVEDWKVWLLDGFDWRSRLKVYFVVPSGPRFRLVRSGRKRATRLVSSLGEAREWLPENGCDDTTLIVEKRGDGRPGSWDII